MTPIDYKAAREKLGLTQRDLAERLGVTRATINAREARRTRITTEAELAIEALVARFRLNLFARSGECCARASQGAGKGGEQ